MNHLMVSFSDYYNAVSIDRVPSNTKIGSFVYFDNYFSNKPIFSSSGKALFSQLKSLKNNQSSASDSLKYTKSCFKKPY